LHFLISKTTQTWFILLIQLIYAKTTKTECCQNNPCQSSKPVAKKINQLKKYRQLRKNPLPKGDSKACGSKRPWSKNL